MRFLSILASAAVGLLASGCHAPSQLPAQALQHPQAKNLTQTWRHSQEEDQGEMQVYRPASYAFPPARGREGYTFAPGGQLTKLAIAPTDGTLPLPGCWRWVSARALHLTFEDSSQQDCRLEVLELTSDVLKVKVLQPR
ncbi:hypothetical protein [Hymenobacter bucti]|uniref:Lipocalin-like domain-containing protein n=1 Tax=Hymenobacter bucti TaxID=1844114 RepID=A0ABW4QZD4_9BACT